MYTEVPYLLSHTLNNMLRKVGTVKVSLFNKINAMPPSWVTLEKRPIVRNNLGLLYEIESDCEDQKFKKWADNFVQSYGALHGRRCESEWLRYLKGNNQFLQISSSLFFEQPYHIEVAT